MGRAAFREGDMESMSTVFTAGCLVVMIGFLMFLGAILVPKRAWVEPALYVCAGGAAIMTLSLCVPVVAWLLRLCRR